MRMIPIRIKPGTSYRKAQAGYFYRVIKFDNGSARCVSVCDGYAINPPYAYIRLSSAIMCCVLSPYNSESIAGIYINGEHMAKKKYDVSGFWGLMTEEEAKETLRYIQMNMHEADPHAYSYERSTQHPHLFLIYALIDEDE